MRKLLGVASLATLGAARFSIFGRSSSATPSAERGLAGVIPTQADSADVLYADDSIDAVALIAVLGEIADPTALGEIARASSQGVA